MELLYTGTQQYTADDSVRTEFGANGANSVLRVARVRGDDAGRYTCTVARAPPPGPPPAHVILHVIKANSVLRVARVRGDDAGRYTCTVARAPPPGPPPAHVILHVIKGEQ
ncbi:Uncharacterized protein OBRU01_08970 [Operophtera brumata]|uniref:Ig-like domain-containing protein n=1 Tax=Operophtera brumata TaxID=104452 RepID=A0A0L7LH12_OPEBR|nr:Uncharacterized protein OBRU01_08970 [Operophtera brumata]